MATPVVLQSILFSLDELSHLPTVLLNLLHVITRLTMCAQQSPWIWDALEQADGISRLVAFTNPELGDLYAYSEDAHATAISRAALLSLYYLCGGHAIRAEQFRARQEKAALATTTTTTTSKRSGGSGGNSGDSSGGSGNGSGSGSDAGGGGSSGGGGGNSLIKHLQFYIHAGGGGGGSASSAAVVGGMESLALHMFCALPYAGRRVRSRLWQEQGHLFYIALLEHRDHIWRQQALEALALWLADGNATNPKRTELERVVLQPKHVAKLVPLFKTAPAPDEDEEGCFVGLLTPYVQLLSSSPSLARACSPIAPDVLARLGHGNDEEDVFGVKVVIELLKILELLLRNLRSPASFIEEHSLDFAMHDMYKRKHWDKKPIVGQVAMQVLHVIERFR